MLAIRQLKWPNLLLWFVVGLTPAAYADTFSEDQIKAVFLFNFPGFIRWPETAFSDDHAPFRFCALTAQTPIIDSLSNVIADESQHGRRLVFNLIKTHNDLQNCQLLFLHKHERSHFDALLQAAEGLSILTVSDADDFIERGGMIALTRTVRRLRPVINNGRLQQVGLKASAKLLQLAKISR